MLLGLIHVETTLLRFFGEKFGESGITCLELFGAQKSDGGLVQSAMTSVDRGHCRCVFEFAFVLRGAKWCKVAREHLQPAKRSRTKGVKQLEFNLTTFKHVTNKRKSIFNSLAIASLAN